jgi:2Fe-2S ferredoxin
MPDGITILVGGVEIPAEPGDSVLAACQRAGLKLETVCKGRGICGACRVLIDDAGIALLPPPTPNEARLLRYLKEGAANHRLACQIKLDNSLSGLRITPNPLPTQNVQRRA